MKAYLLSLGIGLLVGLAYHLSGVRSPAPPMIALVGLLGILAGEKLVPSMKKFCVLQVEQVTGVQSATANGRQTEGKT